NRKTPAPHRGGGSRLGAARGLLRPLVLEASRLAGEVAQVEEARPTDDAAGDDLELLDARAVDEEGALHADVEADLAHHERAAGARALALDHDALEDLDALLVALD